MPDSDPHGLRLLAAAVLKLAVSDARGGTATQRTEAAAWLHSDGPLLWLGLLAEDVELGALQRALVTRVAS